jgi:glycosyltransferase involved in cell wall biosynthesis
LKVIQILHHSPPRGANFSSVFFDCWHARVGSRLSKQAKDFDVECWLPCTQISREIEIVRDGVTYKAFPSFEPFFGCEISPFLVKQLGKLKREDAIIHIHGDRDILTYAICILFKEHPIVIQHHGSSDEAEFRHLNLLALERRAFRMVDHFFVLSEYKKNFLEKRVGLDGRRISTQTMGVDFDLFKPMDKKKIRAQLGLPQDKKLMLYVGAFENHPKGLDVVIESFRYLKRNHDLELVLVGGTSRDSQYSYAKRNTPYVFERQPSEAMPLYYNAADVFTWFCDYKVNHFGGIGMSVVEALACGVPAVSTTLGLHPNADREKLGEAPNSVDDFRHQINCVLAEAEKYKDCRAIAQKYYDWPIIINKTINVYNELCALKKEKN